MLLFLIDIAAAAAVPNAVAVAVIDVANAPRGAEIALPLDPFDF